MSTKDTNVPDKRHFLIMEVDTGGWSRTKGTAPGRARDRPLEFFSSDRREPLIHPAFGVVTDVRHEPGA